jgi:hypothetical protein
MITKPLPYLLLLLACSDGEERSAAVSHFGTTRAAEHMELRAGSQSLMVLNAGWNGGSDTLSWSDSTRRGDTTFAARGRVITTTTLLVDSQWIQPPILPVISGIPFGLFGVWDGTQLRPYTEALTLTYGSESPKTIVARLEQARLRGVRMVTAMTGGARANYLTDGVFDMAKWMARMDVYNTPEIRAAVAQAVNDGVLIGNSVIDEPYNVGGPGNEANSWGPRGTMYKARVDSMCGYAKAIFPTLPQGVFQDYSLEPDGSYKVCDFITSQYGSRKGSLAEYRDKALALCRRDRHACSFSINLLDGGIQAPRRRADGTRKTDYDPTDCPLTTTGGRGTYFPNCRMTAQQVREAGQLLGSAGCFLTGWRYDSSFMANLENQEAFRDIIRVLGTRPAARCIRS